MYTIIIFSVHNLISPKLKKWRDTLFTCTEEMREDFMMSMKKAIVDFVLKDPNTVSISYSIQFFFFCSAKNNETTLPIWEKEYCVRT